MLRCTDSGSLRTRSFFVSSASLLLSAPYLVVYWTAGAGGNGDPWWGPVAFVLFMAHVPVLFLDRLRWRRKIAAESIPQVPRRKLPRALRGNLFSCVLLSLAPVAGLLYVDALPEWIHRSARWSELVCHGGGLLIACLLLASLIYLLLRLGEVALKRMPFLRYVVAVGVVLILLCPMCFSEESGLRMAAGLMAWGLLLWHLIRLSRGGYTEWRLWRDSRLSRILQALLSVGVMYLACTGRMYFN